VRLFYAQAKNQQAGLEVLLDNEIWEQMQREIEKADWPLIDEFYSVRSFLIVQDRTG
jgi:hypothetical protein